MPDFKSECWMVASGIATKRDILSPAKWASESCEHTYSEKRETQQLITHELVHVYPGQLNPSPNFRDVNGIDWFVEGLATYAAGQCNTGRINEVKKLVRDKKAPAFLDQLWTGKLKYELSGSLVMYLDYQFGRNKLKQLLQFNKIAGMLSFLNITETEITKQMETIH